MKIPISEGILRPHGHADRTSKAIGLTLTNCENTFAYLDDILIVTKSHKDKHKKL